MTSFRLVDVSVASIHRQRGFRTALKVCALQAIFGSVWALLTLLHAGVDAGLAALWGAACAVLPTLYMALRVFLRRRGDAPREILGAFYQAAAGKFVLAGVCFWIGARGFPAHFLALMLAYLACLMAYWVAVAVIRLD